MILHRPASVPGFTGGPPRCDPAARGEAAPATRPVGKRNASRSTATTCAIQDGGAIRDGCAAPVSLPDHDMPAALPVPG